MRKISRWLAVLLATVLWVSGWPGCAYAAEDTFAETAPESAIAGAKTPEAAFDDEEVNEDPSLAGDALSITKVSAKNGNFFIYDTGGTPISSQNAGSTVVVKPVPADGYVTRVVVYRTEDAWDFAIASQGNDEWRFMMPSKPVTVYAYFAKDEGKYKVTVYGRNPLGYIVTQQASAYAGGKVTLSICPMADGKLTRLYRTDTNGANETDIFFTAGATEASFMMPDYDVNVYSSFGYADDVYPVTVEGAENVTVSANKDHAKAASEVRLTASAKTNYSVTNIELRTIEGEPLQKLTLPGGRINDTDGVQSLSFTMPQKPVVVHVESGLRAGLYWVRVREASGATIYASKTTAQERELVALEINVNPDFRMKELWVEDVGGHVLTTLRLPEGGVTNESGTWRGSFTMPGKDSYVCAKVVDTSRKFYVNMKSTSSGGLVTCSSRANYEDDAVTLTASPEDGYKLSELYLIGLQGYRETFAVADGQNAYTFRMPRETVNVYFRFADDTSSPDYFPVTAQATGEGQVSLYGDDYEKTIGGRIAGRKVRITAQPADGNTVLSVTCKDAKGEDVSVDKFSVQYYSFDMPSSAASVSVEFAPLETDTRLKALSVSDASGGKVFELSPAFDPDVSRYIVQVDGDTEAVRVDMTPISAHANVWIMDSKGKAVDSPLPVDEGYTGYMVYVETNSGRKQGYHLDLYKNLIPVEYITIKANTVMTAGETQWPLIYIEPSNATNAKNYRVYTSDGNILTIEKYMSGYALAAPRWVTEESKATITVRAEDGSGAESSVEITVLPVTPAPEVPATSVLYSGKRTFSVEGSLEVRQNSFLAVPEGARVELVGVDVSGTGFSYYKPYIISGSAGKGTVWFYLKDSVSGIASMLPVEIRALESEWGCMYSLIYDANGGKDGTEMTDGMEVQVKSGEAYTFPACGFLPPEGKAFKEWRLVGVQKTYPAGSQEMIWRDYLVQPVWVSAEEASITSATAKVKGIPVTLTGEGKVLRGTVDRKVSELVLDAAAEGDGASVEGCGLVQLAYGENTFVLNAVSAAGTVTDSRTVILTREEPAPAFRTQSLLLSGKIGVNFFMDLPVIEGVDYRESYMEFTVSGKTTRAAYDENAKNQEGTYYRFTCYVNSVQMADAIEAVFCYSKDGEEKTVAKTYSVETYVKDFDCQSGFGEKTVALVHAMADYGHYAQGYLSKLRDWEIGVSYAAMDTFYKKSFSEEDLAEIQAALEGREMTCRLSADVRRVTASLYLDSGTGIYLYFWMTDGFTGEVAATVDGKPAEAERLRDGRYRVAVTDIAAHRLGEPVEVVFAGATVGISALSYAKAALLAQSDAEQTNAMYALSRYYMAAKEVARLSP